MTELEERLRRYAKPSSDAERERQERAERMVRAAIDAWPGLEDVPLDIFAKGSYPNRTNVRLDSDVDIAVVHKGFYYANDGEGGPLIDAPQGSPSALRFLGLDFRSEVERAVAHRFDAQCDLKGKTAIRIRENSSRVSADVVPSFPYRHYYFNGAWRGCHRGTAVQRKDGTWVVNYPKQQLENGEAKNFRTLGRYKRVVRILKRVENDLAESGIIDELPSYFVECLVYNVPSGELGYIGFNALTADVRAALTIIERASRDGGKAESWREVNGIKPLFGDGQSWRMDQAHVFAGAALTYLELD